MAMLVVKGFKHGIRGVPSTCVMDWFEVRGVCHGVVSSVSRSTLRNNATCLSLRVDTDKLPSLLVYYGSPKNGSERMVWFCSGGERGNENVSAASSSLWRGCSQPRKENRTGYSWFVLAVLAGLDRLDLNVSRVRPSATMRGAASKGFYSTRRIRLTISRQICAAPFWFLLSIARINK